MTATSALAVRWRLPIRRWDAGEPIVKGAHAIALKLEPFARQMIKGVTLIYLIQKPTPGTGATLFVNAFAQVAFGVPQAEVHNADELRKNLTATLMTGTGLYWIDNVHHKVDNASLALATTTEVWKDRVLGHSKTVVLPVRCSRILSGNNVELSSELARRSVLIRLDANVERPTDRKDFRHPNLLGYVRTNRGQLVWAGLTLIQAWIAAGKPAGIEILASYEPWSQVMGGILSVAGIEGFLENRGELKEVAADEDGPIKIFVQLSPFLSPGLKELESLTDRARYWIYIASTPTSLISASTTSARRLGPASWVEPSTLQGSGL